MSTIIVSPTAGIFRLTGFAASVMLHSYSLKVQIDQFDVDEWGRFYQAGGVRYTI